MTQNNQKQEEDSKIGGGKCEEKKKKKKKQKMERGDMRQCGDVKAESGVEVGIRVEEQDAGCSYIEERKSLYGEY